MIPPQTKHTIKNATYLGKRLGDMKDEELWEAIANIINYLNKMNEQAKHDYNFMADLASRRP